MPLENLQSQYNTLIKIIHVLESRLNTHDISLARLEEKQAAAAEAIIELGDKLGNLENKVSDILGAVKANQERSTMMYKLVTVLLPLIATLEIWGRVIG